VLWLEPKHGLTVLAQPKDPPRSPDKIYLQVWLACAVGALVVALLVVARWRINLMRLGSQNQTQGSRLAEAERELQRLNDSRERLGRDLHDRIIQSIYALGLNIDHCARSAKLEPDQVEARLNAALTDVNGVISELRNVILGLETNAIQPAEFRTALKSLALALGAEGSNRIRLDIDENAQAALTPAQATELVHIGREALSNSIRHGAAATTSFSLERRDNELRFTVEDDGRGFNVKAAEGNGFGLRNMAKRAQHLGANFTIRSEEGRGTRVVLDIPCQKQHFSSHESRTRVDR
jgi:signal transduction histidine kinase